jgi:hypothetical protein
MRLSTTRTLISAIALGGILTAGTAIVEPTAALADTKGNCTPYLSITGDKYSGWVIMYAGSSSGWSPSGSLRITATAYIDGAAYNSVTGTKTGTSVTTPVGRATSTAPSITVGVKVVAHGPAGTVDCSKGTV